MTRGFQSIPPRPKHRRGVALLFALAAISLLTVLILAFFFGAELNRQISFTSTNQIRADIFTRATFEIILGELREEIRSGSTVLTAGSNSTFIYQPTTTADAILKRVGNDGTASPTITKVSAANTALYPTGRVLGSSVPLSTASPNGRYISSATWFGSGGPELGSQSTLPTWVFVTRGNGIEVPSVANARDITKPDYVIGRFAYTVYDIGGLLNANVAGYRTNAATDAAFKSSQAYADLTQVPDMTTANVDSLVKWRNAADCNSAGDYSSYVQSYGEASGFCSTHVGNNAFVSRHDLLNFSDASLGIPADSLPYLTQFSRSLNAPSWGPAADATSMGGSGSAYAYNSSANTTGSANRFLPNVRFTAAATVTHYHDDGTSETYPVAVGDPLVQRRFSLAKLAWLTSSGAAPGISAKAIQSCFGLQWVNNPTTGRDSMVTGNYGWVYIGSTATPSSSPIALSSIETLDQVAAEGREPNFFELLQAGILSGVLGVNNKGYQAGTTPANTLPYTVQTSSFLHVLTIGANLIDQYKNDSYPTVLIGKWKSTAEMITGTKALPMVNSYMDVAGANPSSASNLSLYLTVNLWNPYVLPAGVSAGMQPVIRIHPQGGYSQNDGWNPNAGKTPPFTFTAPGVTIDGWAQISPSNFSSFATPAPVTSTTISSNSGFSTVPSVMGGQLSGLQFPDVPIAPSQKTYVTTALTNFAAGGYDYLQNTLGTTANPFNIVVEFQSPTGSWIPYSYLDGINDTTTWRTGMVHWVNNSRVPITETAPAPTAFSSTQTNIGAFDFKIDPRSTRFNEIQWTGSTASSTSNTNIPFLPLSFLSAIGLFQGAGEQYVSLLFSAIENLSAPTYFSPASLAFNNGGGAAATVKSYPDLDGVQRLADYGLFTGDSWSNTPYGAATGTTAGAAANSPIILNRAFRSLGEMGYAFIDLPWRSINFCDHNNAFGGLLDIFSLADEPAVVDDRVNLNASQQEAMQSLLSGAAQAPDGSLPLAQPAGIATAYNAYALQANGTPTSTLPFNPAQLTDFLYSLGTSDGLDQVKSHREAVVRALAGNTQTRTWNVLIDVVAQVGRYRSTATNLNDFVVDGEKRYWLSAAIDRYTGKVIAESLEPAD